MISKSLKDFIIYANNGEFEKLFKQNVLTLGTGEGDNFHLCSVYFAYFDGGFVFLSSKNSEHIKNYTTKAFANIFYDDKNILKICGLQVKGYIINSNDIEKDEYFKKFPFANLGKNFINNFEGDFYTFKITYAKYTNNLKFKKIIFQ